MLVDLHSDVRTRHLIHLTLRNGGRLFAEEEKSRFQTPGIHSDLCFHLLSPIGELGLLQYTRQVHISMLHVFMPGVLIPHLRHF